MDRDGVINENRADYVKSWEEYVFLPGIFDSLRKLAKTDFVIVVITNQSPINRGIITQSTVETIHRRMIDAIEEKGGRIDAVFYCPHRPDEDCDCRKPRPGLLRQAAASLDLDLSRSFVVGDAVSDMEAAVNAGAQPLMVRTGRGKAQLAKMPPQLLDQCYIADNLAAAITWIMKIPQENEDE